MTRLILALALALLAGCADCGHLTPGGPDWGCVYVP